MHACPNWTNLSKVAESLRTAFADVVLHGDETVPFVRARSHFKIPHVLKQIATCRHSRIRVAHNALAVIRDGYCVSPDDRHFPVRFKRIVECADKCGVVLESELAKR
jgi:hypothetical protein